MTNHVNNKHPPPFTLPTTVELCTLCKKYVFAYMFYLNQVLKKKIIFNSYNGDFMKKVLIATWALRDR